MTVLYFFYHLKTLHVSLVKDWAESARSSPSRSMCTASNETLHIKSTTIELNWACLHMPKNSLQIIGPFFSH